MMKFLALLLKLGIWNGKSTPAKNPLRIPSLKRQYSIQSPKSKRITQSIIDLAFSCFIGNTIYITFRILFEIVSCWRQNLVPESQRSDHRFDCTGSTQDMSMK